MNTEDVVIIGAGAAGLMAAWKLSAAGKKVVILEARDRIGGRIYQLPESEWGYPAQAGAEFVHGTAPITKEIINELGLTFIPEDKESLLCTVRDGYFTLDQSFVYTNEVFRQKVALLNENISVAEFLEKEFNLPEDFSLKNSIYKMVEGYDAADPTRVSALTLKAGTLGKHYHGDGWIKEGYGTFLEEIKKRCEQNGVKIILNAVVTTAEYTNEKVKVQTEGGEVYEANKVIVTVPLPILKKIEFIPSIPEKMELISRIGFGAATKILIKFKDQWWKAIKEYDLNKLSFALGNDEFMAWWTQYPIETNVMMGWMAGPNAQKNKNLSDDELFELGLVSLGNIFSLDKEQLRKSVNTWKVFSWINDEYTQGAYSYAALDTFDACEKFAESINDTVFFAGEAFYSGDDKGTVEGALGSGKEVAEKILKLV